MLVVTHGGFIMEFFNVVKSMVGKPIDNKNEAKNTAIYIFGFSKMKTKEKTTSELGKYRPAYLVLNHKFKDDLGITSKKKKKKELSMFNKR